LLLLVLLYFSITSYDPASNTLETGLPSSLLGAREKV